MEYFWQLNHLYTMKISKTSCNIDYVYIFYLYLGVPITINLR